MASPEFIRRTIETFQPYYKNELSDEDGAEMVDNLAALLRVLADLAQVMPPQEPQE